MKLEKSVLVGACVPIILFGIGYIFWPRDANYVDEISLLVYRGVWLIAIILAPFCMRRFVRLLRGGQAKWYGEPIRSGTATHRLFQVLLFSLSVPVPIVGVIVTLDWVLPYLSF